jgi:hypothetical protein
LIFGWFALKQIRAATNQAVEEQPAKPLMLHLALA